MHLKLNREDSRMEGVPAVIFKLTQVSSDASLNYAPGREFARMDFANPLHLTATDETIIIKF